MALITSENFNTQILPEIGVKRHQRQANHSEMRITNFNQTMGNAMFKVNGNQQSHGSLIQQV